jgi:hypothetical protein
MNLDPSIRVGDLLTAGFFVVGGLGFLWSMRGDMKLLSRDLQAQGKKLEKLETVITAQALQHQRIDYIERRVDDMQHGRGFIKSDVNGVYDRGGKIENLPGG